MKKCFKLSYYLLGFLSIFLIILNAIFSFIYKKYDFENNIICSEIKNELNTVLITSFIERDSCLEDEKILILGQWDGTTEGCFCDNNIYKGKCSENDIINNCEKLKAIQPINYAKINSKYICIKTTEKNYIDYIKSGLLKFNDCPKDSQNCGIINNSGQNLCIGTKEKCPLKISDINSNALEESFPFNYNIYSLKDTNEQILGVLKLNQYIPCIYPGEKNWTKSYELERDSFKCTTQIGNKLNNYRYQELSKFTTTKYSLYKDNNIIDNLTNYDNEKNQNEMVYLYGRNLMGFNSDKIRDFSYEKLISLQKKANKNIFNSKLFSFFLFGEFIFLIISFKIVYSCHSQKDFEKAFYHLYFFGFINGLILLPIILGHIIMNIIIFASTIKIRSNLNIKGNDDFANNLIDILMKNTTKNFILSFLSTGLFIFIVILGVVVLIIFFNNKKKYKNNII